MYKCNEHGKLTSEWCDKCQKIIKCDCSITGQRRFKDLIYYCIDGEMTITIWLEFCDTCGKPFKTKID